MSRVAACGRYISGVALPLIRQHVIARICINLKFSSSFTALINHTQICELVVLDNCIKTSLNLREERIRLLYIKPVSRFVKVQESIVQNTAILYFSLFSSNQQFLMNTIRTSLEYIIIKKYQCISLLRTRIEAFTDSP